MTLQPVGVVGLILTLVVVIVVGLTTVLTSVFVFDTVKVLYCVVGLVRVLYLTSVFVFQAVAVLVDVDVCLTVSTAVSVTVRVFVWYAAQAVADAVMQRQALVTLGALSAWYEADFLGLWKGQQRPLRCYRLMDTHPERYEAQNATGDFWSFWMKLMSALLQAAMEKLAFVSFCCAVGSY
jgi:hypothetical protein